MAHQFKVILTLVFLLSSTTWSSANPDTTKIIADYQRALIENQWEKAIELSSEISSHQTELELHKFMDSLAFLSEMSRFWIDYRLALSTGWLQ